MSVLARLTTNLAYVEAPSAAPPPVGGVTFYVMQYHTAVEQSGYGTESAPLPREPSSCAGGCP